MIPAGSINQFKSNKKVDVNRHPPFLFSRLVTYLATDLKYSTTERAFA